MPAAAGNRKKAESHLRIADERRQDAGLGDIDSTRNSVPTKELFVHFALRFNCAREDLGTVTVCRSLGLFGRGICGRQRLLAATQTKQEEISVHRDN